ncbi:MAG TPA: SpoIIE family protein phosphatase [Thermoanaerobaculia bacterium]|nr:SpoIIE family protein phosphatase [Thermoanaerobaculia bacterium]
MKQRRFQPAVTYLLGLAGLLVLCSLLAAVWHIRIPILRLVLELPLAGGAFLLFLWLLWRTLRSLLFKVGRRLAFSYFLIGVLPIPMVLLLLGVVAYLLSSFFLGHLYHDALRAMSADIDELARDHTEAFLRTGSPASSNAAAAGGGTGTGAAGGAMAQDVVLGYYRGGRRIAGDPRTPEVWPGWAEVPLERSRRRVGDARYRFFARRDGTPTIAAGAQAKGRGVLALYVGDLDRELSQRSDLWVEINRPDDPVQVLQFGLGHYNLPLLRIRRNRNVGEAQKFFKALSQSNGIWDNALLFWGQPSGPLFELATGRQIAEHLVVTLNGTPHTLAKHLFSSSGDIDATAWGLLVALSVLLANVYLAAALMAVFMIVGLSRAVNRMSKATDEVRRGNFSVRIPVRRRDQIGELQRTFNEMAGNLEMLVAASAQKEVLEKELSLARDLQKSLIRTDLPAGQGVEFASLFEPSAAIGGDYFDVMRLSERELAVIIADVSGHGLSTGLRMAMIKAALLILIEETREPEEILRRLDTVVRADHESRFFVTATLGTLDVKSGRLSLTNAGHPPTYLVRGAKVEEILLPGSPLGMLKQTYGRRDLTLERDDIVVWLSDGLIEGTDPNGDPFGYERVVDALANGRPGKGATATATVVRDRLLAAVARHVRGHPANDDRTLVVMRWQGR